jgi:hypothetical protein
MAAFQYYLQGGNRNVGRVGVRNSLVERKRETARCRVATAKVRGEVFAYFHAITTKRHSSVRNLPFGLPG